MNQIIAMVMFVATPVLVLALVIWFARPVLRLAGLPIHIWVYRNPYDRTCKHCGEHQNFYQWTWSIGDNGWWEKMK